MRNLSVIDIAILHMLAPVAFLCLPNYFEGQRLKHKPSRSDSELEARQPRVRIIYKMIGVSLGDHNCSQSYPFQYGPQSGHKLLKL